MNKTMRYIFTKKIDIAWIYIIYPVVDDLGSDPVKNHNQLRFPPGG